MDHCAHMPRSGAEAERDLVARRILFALYMEQEPTNDKSPPRFDLQSVDLGRVFTRFDEADALSSNSRAELVRTESEDAS